MRMKKTQRKRRRTNQTDYAKRFKMLKAEKPRLVFRKTNKAVIAQYTTSTAAQDKVEFGITSKALLQHGWPESHKGSLKSITAAYLTGVLMAAKIKEKKMQTPIVDLGMQRVLHKTKMYAFIKGLIDAGLDINCKEEAFPEAERIRGLTMKDDFTKHFQTIKSNIEKK